MLHLAEQYIRRLVAVKTVPQTAHVTQTFLRRAASCRHLSTFFLPLRGCIITHPLRRPPVPS
jgi:hypothetical protein